MDVNGHYSFDPYTEKRIIELARLVISISNTNIKFLMTVVQKSSEKTMIVVTDF